MIFWKKNKYQQEKKLYIENGLYLKDSLNFKEFRLSFGYEIYFMIKLMMLHNI